MGKAIPTVEGWHSQHMVFAMKLNIKLKKVAMHSMIVMEQKGI